MHLAADANSSDATFLPALQHQWYLDVGHDPMTTVDPRYLLELNPCPIQPLSSAFPPKTGPIWPISWSTRGMTSSAPINHTVYATSAASLLPMSAWIGKRMQNGRAPAATHRNRSTDRRASRAKQELGWTPCTTFEVLIQLMVDADLKRFYSDRDPGSTDLKA